MENFAKFIENMAILGANKLYLLLSKSLNMGYNSTIITRYSRDQGFRVSLRLEGIDGIDDKRSEGSEERFRRI